MLLRSPSLCGIGLLGGQCLSLADSVAVTGTRDGATAAGGPFMLPSLRRFSETVGADLPVRAITKAHVRAFKDSLLGVPSRRTGRPTSPATARKLLGPLASVLSWAVRKGYLDLNPSQGVTQVAAKNDPEARRLPYDEGA